MGLRILVFAERRDGKIKKPTLEALGAARRIADERDGTVDVLALGPGAAGHAAELGAHGADRLIVAEDEALTLYAAQPYAACLAAAAQEHDVAVVLVPGTILGRDLSARATARLRSACMSDVTELSLDDAGVLHGRRPVYSGQALVAASIPEARPAVATLRPNAFAVAAERDGSAEVLTLGLDLASVPCAARTVRVELPQEQELDVTEAGIVVAGGRGLKGPEHFALIRELADALDGAVGASRAVVDSGWIEHKHQVGQTGKVVSSQLYIAVGISGAIQHLAGMSSSKVIVAINKDAEAPIFKIADYGIVGDLFEVLPVLTGEVRKRRA